jgi:hypothetical protein
MSIGVQTKLSTRAIVVVVVAFSNAQNQMAPAQIFSLIDCRRVRGARSILCGTLLLGIDIQFVFRIGCEAREDQQRDMMSPKGNKHGESFP